MEKPLLAAKKLSKTFYTPNKVEILKDISLELYSGDACAIMGASGEGKSTLLHILGTLETPSSGSLEFFGKDLSSSSAPTLRNQDIGFVFQGFHLFEEYTTLENILLPARIARKNCKKGSKSYQRALSLLDKVGLHERKNFAAKLLSGGEKQRVALARALMNNPRILLADEPSGNLDHETSKEIHKLLFSLLEEEGKAMLIVTHDPELSSKCNKRLRLEKGILVPLK